MYEYLVPTYKKYNPFNVGPSQKKVSDGDGFIKFLWFKKEMYDDE